jgi:hypothetical protein
MTERTVTEQQVIDAMNKYGSQEPIGHFAFIYDELFPELPKPGELILVWDNCKDDEIEDWMRFEKLSNDGNVMTRCNKSGVGHLFQNYRRQTPAERGEG